MSTPCSRTLTCAARGTRWGDSDLSAVGDTPSLTALTDLLRTACPSARIFPSLSEVHACTGHADDVHDIAVDDDLVADTLTAAAESPLAAEDRESYAREWAEEHTQPARAEGTWDRPWTTGWWVGYEADGTVRATRALDGTCPGCGQDDWAHGPVTCVDERGAEAGTHSHQHGCGAWHTPLEWACQTRDADGGSYADLRALLDGWWDETRADFAAEAAAAVDGIAVRLRAAVLDARARLAAGEPEDDVLDGTDEEPGAYREAGLVRAWTWAPAGSGLVGVSVAEDGPVATW